MRKVLKKVLTSVLTGALALSAVTIPANNAGAITKEPSDVKSSSYRAYIIVQQAGTFVFRDAWYSKNTGLEKTSFEYSEADGKGGVTKHADGAFSPLLFLQHSDLTDGKTNAILAKGPTTRVDITDAVINKAGTYSVRIDIPEAAQNIFTYSDKNWETPERDIDPVSNSFFNMIGVATDIPRPDPRDLAAVPTVGTAKFTNLELYFDGKLVRKIANPTIENGGIKNDPGVKYMDRGQKAEELSSGNYYTPMAINIYDDENNTNSLVRICKDKSNEANVSKITEVPKKSIEVRFTVEGDFLDPNGPASDSVEALKQAIAHANTLDAAYKNKANIGTTVNPDGSFKTKIQTYTATLDAESAVELNYNADGTVSGGAVDVAVEKTKTEAAKKEYNPDAVGTTFTANGNTYKVTKAATVSADKASITANGEVALTGVSNAKSVNSGAIVENGSFAYDVVSINAKAFSKAKKAIKIGIGAKVKTIGNNAFAGCKKLKNIKIASKVLKKIQGKKTFKFKKPVTIKVPKAKKAAYTKMIKKAGGSANKVK